MKNIIKLILLLSVLGGININAFADGIDEPIPSYYEEPGISRTRDYINQHANEKIDPFTGKLQWHFVDLFIPGNGGLDLKVQRSYSSLNEELLPDYSPVGMGWTMHFGRVLRNATTSICDTVNLPFVNPVLELPDGGRRILYLALDGISWITTDFWKAECAGTAGLNVFSPEGTRYDMTHRGPDVGSPIRPNATYYTSRVTDRNGNWIAYSYSGSAVTGATTKDGRSITFDYKNQMLDSITDGDRIWTYVQNPAPGGGANFLNEVKRPDGSSWKFEYNPRTEAAGSYSMRQATYPAGGVIDYTYDFVYFAANPSIPRSTVIKQKVANPAGLGPDPGQIWNWTYTPAARPMLLDSYGRWDFAVPPTQEQASQADITVVTGPDETRTHYHLGYNSAGSGTVFLIGFALGTSRPGQNEAFGVTPMQISNQDNQRPGDKLVSDGITSAPLIVAHMIGRAGESFTTSYGNFDSFGNPQTITESGNIDKTTNVSYHTDSAKWIIRLKKDEEITLDGETFLITREFDTNANLLNETRAGVSTDFTYTSDGDIATHTDARQITTNYVDYFRGIPKMENQPEGVAITRTVSKAGNVTSQTDGELATTNFSYDGLNRVTGISHPLGNPVGVVWAPTERTVTRSAYRQVTSFDGFGREISVRHTDTARGESVIQTYRVDSLGRRTFASYPNATIGTGFGYDMLGRVKFIFNESNPTISNWANNSRKVYQAHKVYFTNERDWQTVYGYRTFAVDKGELMSIMTQLDFNGPATTMTRNIAGQITSVTQDGVARNYGYDEKFFLTSIIEPESGVTTIGRDQVGNMTTRKVQGAAETSYVYDDRNRVTAVNYAIGTPSVTNTYYKDDKLKSADNGVAKREDIYDANKNLRSQTLTVGERTFLTKYAYNGNDALETLTYGSNKDVGYAPDAFGRARQATPYVSSVAYHPTGQPSSFTYANGVQTTVGINARQWPSSLKIAKGSDFFNMSYNYDPVGNVDDITDTVDSGYNRSMQYDPLDRLGAISGPWGGGSIGYDLRGNITGQQFGPYSLTYTYDAATHRLASVSGGKTYAFSYDVVGNVTGNGTTTFAYNDASNMRCAKCGQPEEILYDYDGMNQRVRLQKNGSQTFFVYGSGGQLLWEETPNSVLKEYIYLGGKQVATREQKLQ